MLSVSGCVMYNGLPPEDASHEHVYSEEYSFDANQHWHAATCEHNDLRKDVAKHTFGDFVVTQDPTLAIEGLKVRTCSVCGYKDEVTIEKLTDSGQGGGDIGGGSETPTWSITDIRFDRTTIELTVGDDPISVTPTIVGEGKFPTSLAVSIADVPVTTTVDGEEVTQNVKIAQLSSNVVESGSAFTVKPLLAGNTKITVTSVGKTEVSKDIDVVVQPKVERHELTLSETDITMNKGSIRVLGCTSTDNVTWTTSDDSVVTLENKTNTGVWLKSLKSSGDIPVVITATICAGTPNEVVKTCNVTVISTDQTVFHYYFINNLALTDLHLYMWGSCGTNAEWPGVSMGEKSFRDKSYNDVYQITVDTEVNPYEKIIVSGKDYNGEFLQTNDIVLNSFKTQNAFTIPELPSAGSDGVRKASIKMSTFNPDTDVLEGGYVTLSMNEAEVATGGTIDVICYTSEDTVDYSVVDGADKIELSNESKNGFTIKGVAAGTAEIHATIIVEGEYIFARLLVTVIQDQIVTYYFANNYQWKNMRVYMWGTKGSNGDFPGVLFKDASVKNSDGVNTYAISFSKYSNGYTNLIVSGMDNDHGWSKTADISFADIPDGKDMIYIKETQWNNYDFVGEDKIFICEYDFGTFVPFGPSISIEEDSKQVIVGQTVDIPVDTNSEYEIINSDDTVVEATKAADKITIKGLKEGSATITAKVNDDVKDTITISVVEDYEVIYYFANNYNWSDLKVYMWDSQGTPNAPYPGVALGERAFIDINGDYIYKISFNRYADNYEGFIITGNDGVKGECKTENVYFADFADNNGIKLTGWTGESGTTATFSFGFYVYELYLNIASSIEFDEGYEIPLTVTTNGENIVYEITSGSDKIELKNESNTGVTIVGKAAGTAIFTATVSDGKNTVTKTVTVNVKEDVPDFVTYYFANNYLWTDLKVFLWNDNETNASFPGVPLDVEPVKNNYNENTYTITFDRKEHNWTNCIVSGMDASHGWCKTYDISFAGLDADNTNMIRINETGWETIDYPAEGQSIYKCTYETGVFSEFVPDVSLSSNAVTVNVGKTTQITVNANDNYEVFCSDDTVCEVISNDNKINIKGLKEGDATIGVTICKGTENEKTVYCAVTVDAEIIPVPTTYLITNIPDGYGADGAVFYVWIFGGEVEGNGQWVAATFSGNTVTFTTDVEFESAVLVRMDPNASEVPSWDAKWNQTNDLTFDSNHTAEVIEGWN